MPFFPRLPFRRPVWRWLHVFIVAAAASPVVFGVTAEEVSVTASLEKSETGYAKRASVRSPARVFATEAGVYELDAATSRVRVWKRGGDASEVLPSGFSGRDSAKNGTPFNAPVGLAKHPEEDKFAVVCRGGVPSVQVYGFSETRAGNGLLSSVGIAFDSVYTNAFQMVTNGVSWDIGSVVMTMVTNYVHVTDAGLVTNSLPANPDGGETELPSDPTATGSGYDVGDVWMAGTVPTYTTNTVVRYLVSTNSCLANATDVAFAGDSAILVSISGDERYGVVPGLVVFDAANPSAPGKRISVSNLPTQISGIDVDPDTGDVYAAVPGLHAVFRIPAPSGGWLSFGETGVIEADLAPVCGVSGESSTEWPLLSNPVDVSVWKPAAEAAQGERVLLVVDDSTGRVFVSDRNGKPLFYVASFGGASLGRPSGVYGIDGEDAFAVADTGNRRVLIGGLEASAFEVMEEPLEDAVYAVVFTAMSPTNLSFRVTCVSGTPAAGDTVSLHASPDLSVPLADWPVATGASQTSFPVGTDLSAAGDSAEYGPVEIPSGESAVFYSVHAP